MTDVIKPDEMLVKLEQDGYSLNISVVKDCLQSLVQTLMDIEVSQILDASRYERSANRRAYRNGYRTTIWSTPIGNIALRIPKLRRGTYYPERLLNDDEMAETLIPLVKLCLLYGINEDLLAKTLDKLNWITLSSYEIHQLCDNLRQIIGQTSSPDLIVGEETSLSYRKYLMLIRQQQKDQPHETRLEEDNVQLDEQFWEDFTRRMSQSGLIVESHQSVLASVNPYAQLQLDEHQAVLKPNFAIYIHPLIDYQLIA